jgi:hypothetical protein
MSTATLAIGPMSDGVQIGIRVPIILLALAGVVLALVAGRRLGILAAIFAAIGSGLLAGAEIVDVAWVLLVSAMAKDSRTTVEDYNAAGNAFTVVYVLVLTIAAAFLVFAFFVKRPADRKALPSYVPGNLAAPGFPPVGYQQPVPDFAPPPAYGAAQGFGPHPGYGQQPGYPGYPGGPTGS